MQAFLRALFGAAVLVLGLAAGGLPARAQPARDRVLTDLRIDETPSCAVITIDFAFPVRYVRHFPYDKGDELRIALRPLRIAATEASALFRRESMVPPTNDFAALQDVIFEGDIQGGPYLTLRFRTPVSYKVKQGSDFRSLTVAVVGPEPSGACPPARPGQS